MGAFNFFRTICYTQGVQRLYVSCFLFIVLLAGCAPRSAIKNAQPLGDIVPPVLILVPGQTAIERFDPPGAGSRVELTISAQVRNNNNFGITLKTIDYEVSLDGRSVGKAVLEPNIFIAAGSERPVKFRVATELAGKNSLIRAVAGAFSDTPLAFRIDGTMSFSSTSYQFSTRKTTLLAGTTFAREVVKAPSLRLIQEESDVFLLRADVPVIRVVIKAANPGDIGYFLYGKDLTVSLANEQIATEDMVPVPLAAGEETRFELLFYPEMDKLGTESLVALNAALEGIPTSLFVEGDLLMDVLGVDTFEVPKTWQLVGFVRGMHEAATEPN